MSGKPKHGMSRTRIYRIWSDMKNRCSCPSANWYWLYGGRGIKVCDEWKDFIPFYNWAMENGYSDTLTIDRINNDGNYEPSNCRWATQQEQSLNKRHLPSRTGYVGVRTRKGCKNYFVAEVCRNRKYYYVGHYRTAEEASIAREEYIRRNNL